MEAGSDRILVKPSLSGLAIVSLVYTAVELAMAFVADQLVFGGIVAGIRVELAALAICVLAPLQAGFLWYICCFEIDAAGLHQNHIPSQVIQILSHRPLDNSIGWEDPVRLMKHSRYIAAVYCRIPEGGVLAWLRCHPRLTWIVLPWKWLVVDIEKLQSMLERYAPVGHPLREFYGVAEDSLLQHDPVS